jgi:transposase
MGVAIGVDSHKSSLAVGVIDELGRIVRSEEFVNNDDGHSALLEWVQQHKTDRVIGIEGSASYEAALARRLLEANEVVLEVPASCRIANVRSGRLAGNRTPMMR